MPPPYFVGQPTPRQGAHHESIMALWELKWKKRAGLGIYPFMGGKMEDLEEVFEHFKTNNFKPVYDFEIYSMPFFPVNTWPGSATKAAFYAGAKDLDPPLSEHLIPFADRPDFFIPVTVRVPRGDAARSRFPTVLQIYGLDGYRTEHVDSSSHHIAQG